MTGCGCLLLVGALVAVLYVLLFGSTDSGEPIAQAVGIAATIYALVTIAGRRSPPEPVRS